jgi:hypothetical protein
LRKVTCALALSAFSSARSHFFLAFLPARHYSFVE